MAGLADIHAKVSGRMVKYGTGSHTQTEVHSEVSLLFKVRRSSLRDRLAKLFET